MASISTTRRVLAVMAVTTALCADQVAVASAAARPERTEIGQIASRIVNRLAQNFKRVMPAALRDPVRQQQPAALVVVRGVNVDSAPLSHPPLSPFEFRLPPPGV
jgi:hypothetical protein